MQDRELLLLVADAMQSNSMVEWIWFTKNLVGNGAHSPCIGLAVVDHDSAPRDCRGHLMPETHRETMSPCRHYTKRSIQISKVVIKQLSEL